MVAVFIVVAVAAVAMAVAGVLAIVVNVLVCAVVGVVVAVMSWHTISPSQLLKYDCGRALVPSSQSLWVKPKTSSAA